ncbi:hypothetical protein ASG75_12525 [Rhodanobacter sp. Soil772]|jgi:hypothetical protein|uniref:DUF3011 domain-containing protein n=1 Tax=Rhodanobacter sp. Soil772 TaxID=1736406 RepID=UPI0006FCE1DC|nr:DUF3011 domain-containing protein [Rhodanobacter sp. Soil772]KRE84715.1 hypothetical protein ASG75_12525 [Rhodanobacter sp. Soil772]
MHLSSRLLLGIAATLLGVLSLPTASHAQSRQGDASIRCESINGKFNRCAVPWRDARLVRQESKGACIREESWGVDRQGLWVDRGCRGLFAASSGRGDYRDERTGYGDDSRYGDRDDGNRRGGWQPGPGWDRQIRLQCDSNKKRYQMCQVDVGRRGRVRLVRQMSDARCSEGYSWGWNRAGVWVNHGCRGQFVVDRRW